jgi:hypothetical protein
MTFRIAGLLLLLLTIIGCGQQKPPAKGGEPPSASNGDPPLVGTPPPAAGNGGGPVNVRAHVMEELKRVGAESPGYGAYSYVLGQDSSKYRALVAELRATTAVATGGEVRERYNIFEVPSSVELGLQMLAALEAATPASHFADIGPFIVTIRYPIGAYQDDIVSLFYVDLSRLNRDAIPELLSAYKERVIDEGVEGELQFSSFRIGLLSIVLNVEDSIGFAQAAYADVRDRFGLDDDADDP